MKKIFFSLMLLLCSAAIDAQTYTASQEQLRSEISSYLSRRGLNPQKQSDGLKFVSENSTFYIEIDPAERKPMFVRLCRYVKWDDTLTPSKLKSNIEDYSVVRAIKVSCHEKYARFSVELFLTDSEEFTDVFDDLLYQVKYACKKINE